MKVYVVIEILKNEVPKLHGVFKNKNDAEKVAYAKDKTWCNIIEKELQ